MAVYTDRKYLGIIASRLEQYKQKKQDLYNFRCPYCGDSKKNRLKARGYIYRKSNDYFFSCHNCSKSTTFGKFLQDIDSGLYNQYALERYSNGETGNHNYKKPDFESLKGNAFSRFANTNQKPQNTLAAVTLPKVSDLPLEHKAVQYINQRNIPKKFWSEVFYCDNFQEYIRTNYPETESDIEQLPADERIVLFYTNEKGGVTNVSGRALSDNGMRYAVAKVSEEPKIFGTHRINKESTVYVVEGQFDSLFLNNCVASGDSNLINAANNLGAKNTVLVFDAEPRNKQIVKMMEKAVAVNCSICVFPEEIRGKDINEMILNGMNPEEVQRLVENNTYNGLVAKMKLSRWKRC
jgi:transcription elongation factor Elf1